ncbi:MAG: DUF1972 domain-containing protein [Roseicyclus sp.]|nr:DUF1972 domain-containing protein [Roseicyclus sp.]
MANKNWPSIAILGSVGVPARYGGFETLADNLVRFHADTDRSEDLSVYCSSPTYPDRPEQFGNATLRYSRFRANGAASVLYDATTLRDAIRRGVDVVLLLGVSGAIALPALARRGTRIVTHVDGLEWQRGKWSGPARAFLHWSERLAVRHSDAVIADSPAIATHLMQEYGVKADVIAYGGDHATQVPTPPSPAPADLPEGYALALCRIEPENNAHMILEAFAEAAAPLVFVGNWGNSPYGRALRARFGHLPHIRLLDPIYAPGPLFVLRRGATAYIHGHSAGGTNPALVEMMHIGHPILAFDCVFNRQTTQDQALFFTDRDSLVAALQGPLELQDGDGLREFAEQHYTWAKVGGQYFDLLNKVASRDP